LIDRYRERLLSMGIQIRTHVVLGGDLLIEDLFRDGYASVFIGTGVWRPARLNIQGETLANVHFGISYLANPSAHELGQTVAIIGTGNVAMDVARTAFRHGAQRVMLFERRKTCRASDHEREYAELDGAEIFYERGIQRITPEGPVFKHTLLDEKNSIIGYEDREELVKADSTIIAVSQGPKDKLVKTTTGLRANDRGLLLVDCKQMTTRPGVFAAGDVVHGSRSVVLAVQAAKDAADAMIKYMEALE
jgi:glutamate synthase (NADPH/NADH) small chain